MPTETEMMERIRMLQTNSALFEQSIKKIESEQALQWVVIEKIKDSLSTIKSQLAAFGVVNTLVLAYIAYILKRG